MRIMLNSFDSFPREASGLSEVIRSSGSRSAVGMFCSANILQNSFVRVVRTRLRRVYSWIKKNTRGIWNLFFSGRYAAGQCVVFVVCRRLSWYPNTLNR